MRLCIHSKAKHNMTNSFTSVFVLYLRLPRPEFFKIVEGYSLSSSSLQYRGQIFDTILLLSSPQFVLKRNEKNNNKDII